MKWQVKGALNFGIKLLRDEEKSLMLHKTSIKLYQFQRVQILQLSLTCAKFHALTLHDHLNA